MKNNPGNEKSNSDDISNASQSQRPPQLRVTQDEQTMDVVGGLHQ
jgi:hypothetical protein